MASSNNDILDALGIGHLLHEGGDLVVHSPIDGARIAALDSAVIMPNGNLLVAEEWSGNDWWLSSRRAAC